MLVNKDPGAELQGLQFNRHQREHVARAAQEGIAFSLNYGAEIMRGMGISLSTIRAGHANMFLSDIFATTFANVSGCVVELYNTDGAVGAARAAGVGAGYYKNYKESFTGMELVKKIEPDMKATRETRDSYALWEKKLSTLIQ
jgi:xylulokinase